MTKRKPKARKRPVRRKPATKKVVAPPIKYTPTIGETVLIIRSSVNFAEGKVGVVEKPSEDGWAVRIKTRTVNAQNYGTLNRDETETTIWASEVKPYTPPKENEKRPN